RISAGNDGAQRVLATPNIDDKRYDTVWTADFRLANKLKLGGRSSADITLDLFNAFNNNMILGRNRQANASAFGTPTAVLSPRDGTEADDPRRLSWVRLVALVAVCLGAAALSWWRLGRPDKRRNLLLVTIDTLRADHVGVYGAAQAQTPVLDGLAARGVRFAR